MRRRFFVDRFANGGARIEGEAAHHLSRVLRAKPGQIYELSDGQTIYLATIARADRDLIEFVLGDQVTTTSPSKLHIGLLIAIVKFDHFEWALEKATELGASVIVPLAAERSEPRTDCGRRETCRALAQNTPRIRAAGAPAEPSRVAAHYACHRSISG